MAALEENNALFPIFILTIIALALVPYTILKLCRAAPKQTKSIHCKCSNCSLRKLPYAIVQGGNWISNFSTYSNLTLVLLLVVMIVLVFTSKLRAPRGQQVLCGENSEDLSGSDVSSIS